MKRGFVDGLRDVVSRIGRILFTALGILGAAGNVLLGLYVVYLASVVPEQGFDPVGLPIATVPIGAGVASLLSLRTGVRSRLAAAATGLCILWVALWVRMWLFTAGDFGPEPVVPSVLSLVFHVTGFLQSMNASRHGLLARGGRST